MYGMRTRVERWSPLGALGRDCWAPREPEDQKRKEVEIAKSIEDLMTSQSITGRRDFSDYEMLDVKIAS